MGADRAFPKAPISYESLAALQRPHVPTLCGGPPPSLTEAEKQEQEAALGGGPEEPQGGSSTLQGHGLWRTATLMFPPLTQPRPGPLKGSQSPRGVQVNPQAPEAVSGCLQPALGSRQPTWPTCPPQPRAWPSAPPHHATPTATCAGLCANPGP